MDTKPVQLKNTLLQKCLAEAAGTFILVFTGCGSIMVGDRFPGSMTSLAVCGIFGLVVTAVIYTLGHISGAHINPAVTLAFAAARHFPAKQIAPYCVSQFSGAFLAIAALSLILPPGESFGATVPAPAITLAQAFAWEVFITFILMFVVMGVATDTRAVGLLALLSGPVTGCSMNPARSFAPALFQGTLEVYWIYLFAPVLGAVLGAFAYEKIRCIKGGC